MNSETPSQIPINILASEIAYGIGNLLAREAMDYMDVRAHAMRVATEAEALARHVGIDGAELAILSFGARWHDAGKLLVDNKYLRKPGKLDPDERAKVEKHAMLGHDLLKAIPGMPQIVADIAAYHHERWDGHGYEKLVGEEIPFAARIVCIADVFDALRSPRDYKPAMEDGLVLQMMTKDAPSPGFGRRAFDPLLLRQFVSMKLADPSVELSAEHRVELSEFASSDAMLDLPPAVRDSGEVEYDALGWRHFYKVDGDDRTLVMSQDPAGRARDGERPAPAAVNLA